MAETPPSDSGDATSTSSSRGEQLSGMLLTSSPTLPIGIRGDSMSEDAPFGSFGLAPTPPSSLPHLTMPEAVKCPLCLEPYREPKVLACFHSFCKSCLLRQLDTNEKIVCPQCLMETQLSVQLGIDSLLSDFGLESVLQRQLNLEEKLHTPLMMGVRGGGGGMGMVGGVSNGMPGVVGAGVIGSMSRPSAYTGSPSSTSSTPPLSDSPPSGVESVSSVGLLMGSGSGSVGGASVHSSLSLSSSANSTTTSAATSTTTSSSTSSLNNGTMMVGPGMPIKATCTGCKSSENATNFCQDCQHFLCANCTMAHQYMHCFADHRVEPMTAPVAVDVWEAAQAQAAAVALTAAAAQNVPRSVPCKCLQHRTEDLRFFCITCNLAICGECVAVDHAAPAHHYADIAEVADMQIAAVETLVGDARLKQNELLDMFKQVDGANNRLNASLARAHAVLDENMNIIIRALEEQRKMLAKDLENSYSLKQLRLAMVDKRIQQMSEKLGQTIDFTSRLVKNASPTEVMVFKQLLDTRLQMFLMFNPDASNVLSTPCEVELSTLNAQTVRSKLAGLLGTPKESPTEWMHSGVPSVVSGMPPTPIGRPPSRQHLASSSATIIPTGGHVGGLLPSGGGSSASSAPVPIPNASGAGSDALLRTTPPASSSFLDSMPRGMPIPGSRSSPPNGGDILGTSVQSMGGMTGTPFGSVPSDYSNYEKWSSALEPSLGLLDPADMEGMDKGAFCPPRSQIKRQKMIYHCKFGEFGVMEGQFTEPSGVAVNGQGDIVVADTNNHRIQVFDKEGRFKFQFGECGKRDGQLLYPNRVAVNKITGEFIVTERSPTHQIQVYNQYGQFERKFGANILQHPRGVCVDNKGRIVVVECKVMRVIIFDMGGNILMKFSCSRYLEFPNGVCTNEKNEILISDNRAHCIKVFSYEGQFLRQIGGEGVTNYPIGVGITSTGEVVVADNHNNFNLTVFAQDGTMVGALESKVKHAQCFDVALVDDGSVVLASKDYRLYLYRFANGAALMQ